MPSLEGLLNWIVIHDAPVGFENEFKIFLLVLGVCAAAQMVFFLRELNRQFLED